MRIPILIACVIFSLRLSAQHLMQAEPEGGPDQLEQVMSTQMTLPKILLTPDFAANITAVFRVAHDGRATNVRIDRAENNVLRHEAVRMLKFLTFKKNQAAGDTSAEYLNIFVSTTRYKTFMKQKSRHVVKRALAADSSFTVYSRADISPEYYKGGEEGLNAFLLSELEYPKVAEERSIEGTVMVLFVVETNGYVTNVRAGQGVNGGCTEEAVRLIKMTRWQPAVLGDRLVRYSMSFPVTFRLQGSVREVQAIGQ